MSPRALCTGEKGKGKSGKPGKPSKGFDGRHAVEKKSASGKPVRKAGWAKPKKKSKK